jgi:hypothetical protein
VNRRKFLLTSGSALLGSTSALTKEPVLGLEFELVNVQQKDPSKVDSIMVDFEKFELLPKYIGESKEASITFTLDIEDHSPVSKTVDGVGLTNGEKTTYDDVNSKLPILKDNISASEKDFLTGTIKINIDHPDVSDSYQEYFSITKTDTTVLEYIASNFVDSTNTWETSGGTRPLSFYVSSPSKTTFSNGDTAVNSNGGLGTFAPPEELNGSSLQQITIEMDVKSDVGGDPSPWGFGDSNGKAIRLNFNEGNNFYVEMRDEDGNNLRAEPTNTLELSDGVRRKVTVSFDGPSNNVKVIVDGTDVQMNYIKTQSPSISTNLSDVEFGVMGLALHYENGGNSRRSAAGLYGKFRLHDEFLTKQTI